MLGLDYYSSDEDEHPAPDVKETQEPSIAGSAPAPEPTTTTAILEPPAPIRRPPPEDAPTLGPLAGPLAGPVALPDAPAEPLSTTTSTPSSPHTYTRSLIHSLTLPTHPNTSIPASPPGSPRPSTTTKIRKFLDLKTRSIHFNAKLASSSALSNPELLKSLMAFAGVGEEYDQYASVLSEDVAVVKREGLVTRAYFEELNRSQERIGRRREEERRAGKREREFVRAGGEVGTVETRDGKRRKG